MRAGATVGLWCAVSAFVLCNHVIATSTDYEIVGIEKIGWSKFFAAYQSVNDFLTQSVVKPDAESNFIYARNAYNMKLQMGESEDEPFMIALRLFISLHKIINENKCDYESYLALKYNREAEVCQIYGRERRLDRITREIAEKHADMCKQTYFKVFESKFLNLDKGKLQPIEFIFSLKRIVSDRSEASKILYSIIQEKILASEVLKSGQMLNKLKQLAKDDPDRVFLAPQFNEATGKGEMNDGKFRDIFRRYIIEPCEYLREELGKPVFRPAELDARFKHKVNIKLPEFYYAWARSILCDFIAPEIEPFGPGSIYKGLKVYAGHQKT